MYYLARRKRYPTHAEEFTLDVLAEHPLYERIERLYDAFRNTGHHHLLVLKEMDMRRDSGPGIHMPFTRPDVPPDDGASYGSRAPTMDDFEIVDGLELNLPDLPNENEPKEDGRLKTT